MDPTKPPKAKKPKTSVSELNAEFDRAKADIRSKYTKQITTLEGQITTLKGQMTQGINELNYSHEKAVIRAEQYEIKEKAGTLGEEYTCGTCGVKLDMDTSNPDDLDWDKVFSCELGKFCGSGEHCNSHKTSTTTCSNCNCSYCGRCVDSIDKCAMCWRNDVLTCGEFNGDLDTMPCGELACNENNCKYYHYKHCDCEEEARKAGFERYKRES